MQRLGGALDVATPDTQRPLPLLPPRPGELQLAVPRDSIGGLDFLALRGCALQVTVGRRNSSLGRFAPPSQRLLLELEFLRLAPDCIVTLRQRDNAELADTLAAARQRKQRLLPLRIYNATLASDEFRSLWQTPAALGNYPASTNGTPPAALEAIAAGVFF